MSQYNLETHDPQYIAYCGWDRPLSTFFLTVELREAPEAEFDVVVFSVGPIPINTTHTGSVLTVDLLQQLAEPWATISPELSKRLKADWRSPYYQPGLLK